MLIFLASVCILIFTPLREMIMPLFMILSLIIPYHYEYKIENDTIPLSNDKEIIDLTFYNNVDSMKSYLDKYLINSDSLVSEEKIRNQSIDPKLFYMRYALVPSEEIDSVKFYKIIPKGAKSLYQAHTKTIVYNKNKDICLAFIEIKRDSLLINDKEINKGYSLLAVFGVRKEKLKIYPIDDTLNDFFFNLEYDEMTSWEKIFQCMDVYIDDDLEYLRKEGWDGISHSNYEKKDFFEKNLWFNKHDNSTYNFQWYKASDGSIKKYNYPY